MQKGIFMMLSDSKINMGAIVPSFLEYGISCVVVVRETSELLNCKGVVINDGECSIGHYPIENISGCDYIEVKEKLEKRTGTVVVVSCNSRVFKKILLDKETEIIVTACREGLIDTYIPFLKTVQHRLHIVSFDNDETLIERAQEQCGNDNLMFSKGIIHCMCPYKHYNEQSSLLEVTSDKRVSIILPPEAKELGRYLAIGSPFDKNVRVHMCDNHREFDFFIGEKIVTVNGIHSLLSIIAYVIGLNKGEQLADIAKLGYKYFIPRELAEYYGNVAFMYMYDDLLTKCDDEWNSHALEKEARRKKMVEFIRSLYEKEDIIERGINWYNLESIRKVERHLKMLSVVTEPELAEYIKEGKILMAAALDEVTKND